jgi:hypothetical protein
MFGLPLTVIDVGTAGLERELALLLAEAASPAAPDTTEVPAASQTPARARSRPAKGSSSVTKGDLGQSGVTQTYFDHGRPPQPPALSPGEGGER